MVQIARRICKGITSWFVFWVYGTAIFQLTECRVWLPNDQQRTTLQSIVKYCRKYHKSLNDWWIFNRLRCMSLSIGNYSFDLKVYVNISFDLEKKN